ncbi:hypothetical protein U8335_03970 [Roseiconus lacunae]|uniref:hypothetical protein n=1 Tax=Roseiconus lacunae TaxID=2605694 RepID=UPI00308D20AA|nr:hypothetical protein U8335_03970 [Stieleria sp. HD01]
MINNDTPNTDDFRAYADAILRHVARSHGIPAIMPAEYRNPFDLFTEFDAWFEFERRRHVDKEPTHRIIRDMLADNLQRAAAAIDTNRTAAKMQACRDAGRVSFQFRGIVKGVTT